MPYKILMKIFFNIFSNLALNRVILFFLYHMSPKKELKSLTGIIIKFILKFSLRLLILRRNERRSKKSDNYQEIFFQVDIFK